MKKGHCLCIWSFPGGQIELNDKSFSPGIIAEFGTTFLEEEDTLTVVLRQPLISSSCRIPYD